MRRASIATIVFISSTLAQAATAQGVVRELDPAPPNEPVSVSSTAGADAVRDAATEHPTGWDERPSPWAVDVGVGTVVPLYLGGQVVVEGPLRLLASFELGWMPKPYAYGIDDLLQTFGVYPDEVSQLIREALKSSLVLRPSLGWRPFPKLGFEVTAGYTFLTLGGGLSARQAIETATGRTLPNETPREIPLHSTLHNVHVQLAWRFLIGDHFVLRASLAYLHTLASSTGIDASPRTMAGKRVVAEANERIDDYLNGYYTKYVHAPLLGVTAAYRF